LHLGVPSIRTTVAGAAAVVAAGLCVSGGSGSDPRTPPALPAKPPPFLSSAVLGSGRASAGVDAYGDIVDLRASPAGPPLIHNPIDRQAAGSVPADTGIVPWVRIGDAWLPPWRAREVEQDYLGSKLITRLSYGNGIGLRIADSVLDDRLVRTMKVSSPPGRSGEPALGIDVASAARCRKDENSPRELALVCEVGIHAKLPYSAVSSGGRRRPLGPGAPGWARRLYTRSLLVLRSLLDRRTGALAGGARDGWAYVWPRDAATAALALEEAGYRPEARRIVRFLDGLDLSAAARFDGRGNPVPGRGRQGDAAGWVATASRAVGLPGFGSGSGWRDLPDYQESAPGDYLADAIASRRGVAIPRLFGTSRGLVRSALDPSSGLDSAAAWAVRPFSQPALYPAARRTMLRLVAASGPFGMTPGEGWRGGDDPWTAPTAWTAWSLAALARGQRGAAAYRDRRAALRLMVELRRAATPLGLLPERVDARTGVPTSTTPLAWSHAFAILALRELWPPSRQLLCR
jgi:hypothetical protein